MSETYDINGYFPIEWNFGISPSDGRNGSPCDDPSLIQITVNDEDIGTVSLKEMIEIMIDSSKDFSGKVAPDHRWAHRMVSDFLRAQADKIDEAMK